MSDTAVCIIANQIRMCARRDINSSITDANSLCRSAAHARCENCAMRMRTISGGRHDRANWADKSLPALMVTRARGGGGETTKFYFWSVLCRGGAGAGEPFFFICRRSFGSPVVCCFIAWEPGIERSERIGLNKVVLATLKHCRPSFYYTILLYRIQTMNIAVATVKL